MQNMFINLRLDATLGSWNLLNCTQYTFLLPLVLGTLHQVEECLIR